MMDMYYLNHITYKKVLEKFYDPNCLPVFTLYDPNLYLKKNKGHLVLQRQYAQIIGSLGFLTNYTKPDITYAVNRLSRYISNPDESHCTAVERVLRYFKGTIAYGFTITIFIRIGRILKCKLD